LGKIKIEPAVSPNATAYDSSYPTRSTELYCNVMHNLLQDMDDQGDFWAVDGVMETGVRSAVYEWWHDTIEEVFDYADTAISDHRTPQTISISKPTKTSVTLPTITVYPEYEVRMWDHYAYCMKMMYLIYYMWKTETDPLLLKEKLQELLVAWPLHDITVELNEDMGQQFKVYPSWKSAEL